MSGPLDAARWTLVLCGAVVAADQASKALVEALMARGERVEVLPFLAIENTRNRGVAFGLFSDVSPLLVAATVVGLVAVLVFLAANVRRPLIWLPAGLLLGGALGNLADRVRIDSVVDFVDLPAWPTFNLADVAIVAGVLALLLLPQRAPER